MKGPVTFLSQSKRVRFVFVPKWTSDCNIVWRGLGAMGNKSVPIQARARSALNTDTAVRKSSLPGAFEANQVELVTPRPFPRSAHGRAAIKRGIPRPSAGAPAPSEVSVGSTRVPLSRPIFANDLFYSGREAGTILRRPRRPSAIYSPYVST